MTLKLQMLGTGGAFAKSFYNNNALIFDENFTLLIDCGVTAPMALHRLGQSFESVDAVLITHIHADHVGGLEELAFIMKLKYNRKIPLYIADALVTPLWENTLSGGLYQEGHITSLYDVFDVRPLQPGTAVDISPGIRAELLKTRHIPGKDSYSIYFNDRIFYSGDMIFDPELLNQLVDKRGCEVILHECQLEGHGAVHTTLEELLSLPDHIRGQIYLMHYGDEMRSYEGRTDTMQFLVQQRIYEL